MSVDCSGEDDDTITQTQDSTLHPVPWTLEMPLDLLLPGPDCSFRLSILHGPDLLAPDSKVQVHMCDWLIEPKVIVPPKLQGVYLSLSLSWTQKVRNSLNTDGVKIQGGHRVTNVPVLKEQMGHYDENSGSQAVWFSNFYTQILLRTSKSFG